MSYSRHTVNEEDLQTEADDTNFKMHMQVRRMVSDQRNQVRKRRKTVENNNAGAGREASRTFRLTAHPGIAVSLPLAWRFASNCGGSELP